ncbi:MAG: hypothetical protein RLZ14_621, partial [Actinomycetota bacterium]
FTQSSTPGAQWDAPIAELRTPRGMPGDPLYAVYASARI